ncbi:hypothetical protein [Pontibacillus litoralis]|uniref:Copper amine oxidase-like N-terminal domain-containing protein n=1 Tax=Pontibacillus litoralis JSM 072002 TaxID=1385512 RepID=A0A0A5G5R2_9BACI|nr:hypothetical protein [Pontibacillus litoralis]KGX87394.1 hypothetical protein N784_15560 [Pontibacillus litoralis JSM 072002]
MKKFNLLILLGLFMFLMPTIISAEEQPEKVLKVKNRYETPFEDVILKESNGEERVIITGTKETKMIPLGLIPLN